jgi:hypothetical protein
LREEAAMTHFTVGVIVPAEKLPEVHDFIAKQMAPFDENTKVEPYVCFSIEQAKAEIERDIRRFEQIIHTKEAGFDLDKCRDIVTAMRTSTPEQRYREYVQHHEQFNTQGEPLSTYNPDSKWDWWVIGGRWDGWINGMTTSHTAVSDNLASTAQVIERGIIPHAIITPDGHWHARGQMGWWAIQLTDNEGWVDHVREILARYPDDHLVIVDAHI